MADDNAYVIIVRRADSLVLLRGYGLLGVLNQFRWAQRHQDGVLIPAAKLEVALGSLTAAGYQTATPDSTAPRRRQPLPLPECAQCTMPLRRARTYPPRCPHCSAPLVVMQADPDWEPDHEPSRAGCAHHPHGLYQVWPTTAIDDPAQLELEGD